MNPTSPSKTPSAQSTRPCLLLVSLLLLVFCPACPLHAQVGNQNPAGPSGIFNGQAGACGYDPYTGNATRSTVEISIAGAVSPLALVRTFNSRTPSMSQVFGRAGGWNHNYNWILEDSPVGPIQPTRYTVDFPDGRVETFRAVNWNPVENYYRVRPGPDTPAQATSSGVRERFVPISGGFCYLILPDGGKVEFAATRHGTTGHYYYTYRAQAIYDPYGLKTTLAYDGQGRLSRVTEPAGRYLEFSYRGNSRIIDHVTAHPDGRKVQYNYSNISPGGQTYLALTSVVYYDHPEKWKAIYTYQAPNLPPVTGVPLLRTCDDPMYSGAMDKIAYTYQTTNNADGTARVYGQIRSENYYNGAVGAAVSTLTVGAPNNHNIRKETRGDGPARTFTYTADGYLTDCTDFMNHTARQTYDAKKYINSVTDRNSHTTNYICAPKTGNVTQIIYPLTAGDTEPQQTQRSTVNYTYEADYYLQESRDEAGNPTTYTRNPTTHRVTGISYPDGGSEAFTYDANHWYQLQTHTMTTGGVERFSYYNDGTHLRETYRNPDNAGGNPTAQYQYDQYDRVSYVTDVLGQTTDFTYNLRGQVLTTTFPVDPFTNERRKITNVYNDADGTLQSKTDHFNHADHTTNYSYDDYRRLKRVITPDRGDGNGTHTTSFYYDPNGTGDDYRYTDSNVTWVTLPSSKRTHTVYDDNRRKKSVTAGSGTETATTSYEYDDVGNLRVVKLPLQQAGQQWAGKSTITDYDARNRPYQITDADNHQTTFTYDWYGRKKKIHRPNGQDITYEAYDGMNRLKQQRVKQSPSPDAVTKYTYYGPGEGQPVGLLHTMQDPRQVIWGDQYEYRYDLMGRKQSVTYPLDSSSPPVHRVESFQYDTSGRLWKFTNRNNKTQTFAYDGLNRMISFSWDDSITPSTLFHYDGASRLTDAITDNYNITVHRDYFDDGLLKSETDNTTPLGGTSKTMNYSYNADGNRSGITYPNNAYSFTYSYNSRNQLNGIGAVAGYGYDLNGNLLSRDLLPRGGSSYTYDALDRVKHIHHSFYDGPDDPLRPTPTPRPPPAWRPATLDYDYDSVGNRKWTKRGPADGGICYGDVFRYDLNDQVTGVFLDIEFPDTCEAPPVGVPTISYDGAGNRIAFAPYGWQEVYAVNALNQYTTRTTTDSPLHPTPTPRPRPSPRPRPTPPGQQAAAYDYAGNMTTGFDGSTYEYDAQNRLLSATKDGVTMQFKYDGLNRQVKRTVNGTTTFSVWDGWDLIEEYQIGNNVTARYLYGPGGLIKNLTSGNYYFQDGSGSTSHLTDNQVQVIEWYLYDLQGAPSFFDADGNELLASAYGVRHLFTGQQWYSDIGLYDLRNRFYSPDIGRFLQADPIGFNGDGANLYRYCGNNPLTRSDPMGTDVVFISNGLHNFVGVTSPGVPGGGGMTYFDFNPTGLLSIIAGPGMWTSQYERPQGFQWETLTTTPAEDARVLAALNAKTQYQGDLYSVLLNNCYTAPADVVDEALNSNTDTEDTSPPAYNLRHISLSGGDDAPDPWWNVEPSSINPNFSLTPRSGINTPFWGNRWIGGSPFGVSGPPGLNIPGGINWSPGSPGGFIPNNIGMIMGMHSPGFQRALRMGMVRPNWLAGYRGGGADTRHFDRGRHQSRPPEGQ